MAKEQWEVIFLPFCAFLLGETRPPMVVQAGIPAEALDAREEGPVLVKRPVDD